jgi:hypothetical protein
MFRKMRTRKRDLMSRREVMKRLRKSDHESRLLLLHRSQD